MVLFWVSCCFNVLFDIVREDIHDREGVWFCNFDLDKSEVGSAFVVR